MADPGGPPPPLPPPWSQPPPLLGNQWAHQQHKDLPPPNMYPNSWGYPQSNSAVWQPPRCNVPPPPLNIPFTALPPPVRSRPPLLAPPVPLPVPTDLQPLARSHVPLPVPPPSGIPLLSVPPPPVRGNITPSFPPMLSVPPPMTSFPNPPPVLPVPNSLAIPPAIPPPEFKAATAPLSASLSEDISKPDAHISNVKKLDAADTNKNRSRDDTLSKTSSSREESSKAQKNESKKSHSNRLMKEKDNKRHFLSRPKDHSHDRYDKDRRKHCTKEYDSYHSRRDDSARHSLSRRSCSSHRNDDSSRKRRRSREISPKSYHSRFERKRHRSPSLEKGSRRENKKGKTSPPKSSEVLSRSKEAIPNRTKDKATSEQNKNEDLQKDGSSSLPEKSLDEKTSPKPKSADAKLKVINDIWRKVRDKSRAHLQSNNVNIPESPKAKKDAPATPKDKERSKSTESARHSSSLLDKSSKKWNSPKFQDKGNRHLRHPSVQKEKRELSPTRRTTGGSRKSVPRRREIRSPLSSYATVHKRRDRSKDSQKARVKERAEEIEAFLTTEPSTWIMSTPAENYYSVVEESKEVVGTDALKELHAKFQYELVERADRARACRPKYEPPQRKIKLRKHKPPELHAENKSSSDGSSEESSADDEDTTMEELKRKRRHPYRLHPELWFNDSNEMNDGPLCRCSAKARRSGIRHGIYVEEGHLPRCKPHSNNAKILHHYKICVTPITNFTTKSPTIIMHEGQKYIFEGFSMFSHRPLQKLPNCKVIRFNYEYTLMYVEEKMPSNFTVAGLELFSRFLLQEILELVDLDWKAHNDPDGCPQFHFMPRFARRLPNDGKELLSFGTVLEYLLEANMPLIDESQLSEVLAYSNKKWQELADKVKGMIVTCPGMKPSSIRIDQLDREHTESSQDTTFPIIVHFGIRPPQLSYAGNPYYQKAWRNYVKYRHLLANKPKVNYADKHKLFQKEQKLQEMRMENDLKRDVTVVINGKGFFKTGLMSDMVQHAMLLPILVCHLRFHASLATLENKIGYKFQDRFLLQLALTHPSYRENFGTNPDHARNSLTNCGLRQPQYGDRRIHYLNTRKRGINTLINIMSRFGNEQEAESQINHNERLEFLGDAVVEFLSSIHLFYMFPDLEEGGLATYRAAIVQNQHLAVLSKKLELETYMLYAHGSDLCHDLELKHAMANCFESLMGALFLDGGIEVADKIFSNTLFPEPELQEVWKNYPLHPLQEQEPNGDRKWIESIPLLQKLHKFEEQIGIEFNHIRLLARALTHRSLGYNNLTLGSNQRLEFLGDTVLQLVSSEYLYKFFPQHHEGHLSLLRSSLVNNRTQGVVCGELGMMDYAIYPYYKVDLKPKDKADILEAFLGALYVDKDLGYCRKFCEVCFFPRLQDFIMNQDWNDPKSKLQQCCLTLRSMEGGEPDIPTYKVIECKGPTNTRVYGVAVYFQGNRLAVGEGHSIQLAEMDAASNALKKSKDLFPQLRHQKRAIERSLKQGSSSPRDRR